MQVFKVFFKIIKKNMGMISIYIVIFIGIAVLITLLGNTAVSTDFTQTKSPVAVINHDTDSELVKGFTAFIGERFDLVELKDEPEALHDALFFRRAEAILTIPQGFTDAVMSGRETAIEKMAVPDSMASFYTDLLVDNYLNTARLYVKNVDGISQEALVGKVGADLSQVTKVTIRAGTAEKDSSMSTYFNSSAYSILAVLILGVSSFMLAINKPDLRRRILCAPISTKSINTQSLLANLVFAAAVWTIINICAVFVFGERMLTINGLLFALNLFVFMLVGLCLSYLLGTVIKNRNAQSAAANTISLGMSFLSGVFVPQYILSDTVKSIASFTPTFWFVKANNDIGSILTFNGSNIQTIINGCLIQLAFAAGLLALTFIVTAQRRSKVREMPALKKNTT